MAQSGYTPISLYYSTTAAATPSSSNLTNGELAINITDGILYYKNSSGTVVPLTSSSGGITWQSVQSANFTATAGNAYPINTTSAAITVTLPASPTAGQLIGLLDYAGTFATNNVVVNPNGNNLNGATSSVKLDQNNEGITFVYSGATQGWVSYSSYKAITPPSAFSVNYLIVAGGGGGASNGAGAGAGGLISGSGLSIDKTATYTVSVGAGGTGGVSNGVGTSGGDSSFSAYGTAAVGGGRGGSGGGGAGAAGGSGGGGAAGVSGYAGTSGQGNAGGNGGAATPPYYAAGGGGGAGAVGGNGNSSTGVSGNGGVGVASSISGASTYYAGGGGGGGYAPVTGGSGGNGGGGAGFGNANGGAGTANTGGGGGGAGYNNGAGPGQIGGSGGSGTVIVSYADTVQQMAGGSVTSSGGNIIHTFNSSGYLTPLTYVGNSLRFKLASGSTLSRTPSSTGNQTTWTWSGWLKRGQISSSSNYNWIFDTSNSHNAGASFVDLRFDYSTSTLTMNSGVQGGATYISLTTTQVFRDPAAWYHLVVAVDTTQATASNRVKLYVNGTQITSFSTSTYPSQNQALPMNQSGVLNYVGNWTGSPSNSNGYDGQMANIQLIDGQQLTPNSFGSFNLYGVWQPISYGGTYGTNGYYLKFNNTTSTTTLGYDSSGNSNNFTCTGISLTAGSTYDSMTDVPTLTSETAANYPVWNPLYVNSSFAKPTITNGNLALSVGGSDVYTQSTFAMPTTGKYYWEVTYSSSSLLTTAGLATAANGNASLYVSNGQIYILGTLQGTTVAAWSNGDVIGVALDMDGNSLKFYKNNTLITTITAYSGTTPIFAASYLGGGGTGNTSTNFGQQPFVYTPPSGFLALNTYNM
jgi:hypothetical protein